MIDVTVNRYRIKKQTGGDIGIEINCSGGKWYIQHSLYRSMYTWLNRSYRLHVYLSPSIFQEWKPRTSSPQSWILNRYTSTSPHPTNSTPLPALSLKRNPQFFYTLPLPFPFPFSPTQFPLPRRFNFPLPSLPPAPTTCPRSRPRSSQRHQFSRFREKGREMDFLVDLVLLAGSGIGLVGWWGEGGGGWKGNRGEWRGSIIYVDNPSSTWRQRHPSPLTQLFTSSIPYSNPNQPPIRLVAPYYRKVIPHTPLCHFHLSFFFFASTATGGKQMQFFKRGKQMQDLEKKASWYKNFFYKKKVRKIIGKVGSN